MTFEEALGSVSRELNAGTKLIDDGKIVEFQIAAGEFHKQLEDILEEGRVMRLGIVGEVKAGKSSFLNALLFEGEDVLPKAPTPMTAALTRISYSDHPSAKVVFYTRDDWELGVVQLSDRYEENIHKMYDEYRRNYEERRKNLEKGTGRGLRSIPATLPKKQSFEPKMQSFEEFARINQSRLSGDEVACHEVYELARQHLTDAEIQQCLGQEKIVRQDRDTWDYLSALNDYVGSDGKYTPIVKYTEIQLDNEMLKGIEVIDTPGLNDPIISRSRVTQKFLTSCDAVFLLSYCGQFLGAEDMSFLLNTLPDEGIRHAVLVGTKMDSAILQYPARNASFRLAYMGTKKNCFQQAKENLESSMTATGKTLVLKRLLDSLPPICTSAIAYSIALKLERGERLKPDESKVVENLKRFSGFQSDAATMRGLSSIPDIQNRVFQKIREDKEQIKAEKIQGIEDAQRGKFTRLLEEIAIQVRTNQKDLRESDLNQLIEKLRSAKEGLDSARATVTGVFASAANTVMRASRELEVEVRKEVSNHFRIEVHSDTREEEHSSTSGHLWWKKTHYRTEHITTHTAELSDVNHNIEDFYTDVLEIVNNRMKHLFKIEEVKEQVSQAVMRAFDGSDRSFDENAILIPLNTALDRITIPNITLDLEKYHGILDQKLTGVVTKGVAKNEDIPLLKKAQDEVLSAMSSDICDCIRKQGTEMSGELERQAGIFIDGIAKTLEENHSKLEELIQDRENSLKAFDAFLATLNAAKQRISGGK